MEFTIICHEPRPGKWVHQIIDSEGDVIFTHRASGPMPSRMSPAAAGILAESLGSMAGLTGIHGAEFIGESVFFQADEN